MDFNEYQSACQRTANTELDDELFLASLGLGIAGEAGEIADTIKKVVGHGHATNQPKMREELGDLMWYIATIANMYGILLDNVAEKNVEKLKERYPTGFSSERSINRLGD